MTLARDFKGIWIPKEIWLHPELSLQAKALWAEIHSLYSNSHGGCFASNEYLCQFLGVKERALQYILKELRDNSLLVDVSFDGRRRIFKALDPSIGAGQPRMDSAEQGCKTLHPSDAKKCHPESEVPNAVPIYTEKKDIEKSSFARGRAKKPLKTSNLILRKSNEFAKVEVSDEDHKRLLEQFGEEAVLAGYDELLEWKTSKAQTDPKALSKHTDYGRLRKWVIPDAKKEPKSAGGNPEWQTVNANKDFFMECKVANPEIEIIQAMHTSGNWLIIPGSKELSLKMNPEAFKKAFLDLVGGVPDED